MVQNPFPDLLVHVKTLKFRYHFSVKIHLNNTYLELNCAILHKLTLASLVCYMEMDELF